jgi:hypothetical protein
MTIYYYYKIPSTALVYVHNQLAWYDNESLPNNKRSQFVVCSVSENVCFGIVQVVSSAHSIEEGWKLFVIRFSRVGAVSTAAGALLLLLLLESRSLLVADLLSLTTSVATCSLSLSIYSDRVRYFVDRRTASLREILPGIPVDGQTHGR